jgi:septal ring factor EnvC (AmiA/AmiB activator)
MAIKKTIEIDVNSQGATSGINNVTNSIEQTDKATKSLKAQLKEATLEVQKLADEFGATSKEVIEASKRAADLKDRIEDANDSILAFKGEGAFNATAKALGSVASGFSAVEGAIVLAGGQSEEFQQTMLKLQGAMALAQGLEGLEDAGRSFKQLGAVAKNALAGIRTGIAATGIGVLLIALGAVVAYWDDIKEAVNGVSSEQEELNTLAQKNLDTEQKKLDSFSLQENSLLNFA